MRAFIVLVFLILYLMTFCHGAYDAPTAAELAEVKTLLKSCFMNQSTCPKLDSLSRTPTAVRLGRYEVFSTSRS